MMPRDVIMLSDDQFNKLVELLTPGYELAKAYLAEAQERQARFDLHEAEREARERGEFEAAQKAKQDAPAATTLEAEEIDEPEAIDMNGGTSVADASQAGGA